MACGLCCAGSEGRMGITPHPWGAQSPQEPFSPIVAYLDIFATPLPPSVLSLSNNGALTGNGSVSLDLGELGA